MSEKISLAAALKAQKAMRDAAGMKEEEFGVAEFVGMVSDEIEALRNKGRSDDEIAKIISTNSQIEIDGQTLARHYAPPEARNLWEEEKQADVERG